MALTHQPFLTCTVSPLRRLLATLHFGQAHVFLFIPVRCGKSDLYCVVMEGKGREGHYFGLCCCVSVLDDLIVIDR